MEMGRRATLREKGKQEANEGTLSLTALTIRCNVVPWVKSWNRKAILGKN